MRGAEVAAAAATLEPPPETDLATAAGAATSQAAALRPLWLFSWMEGCMVHECQILVKETNAMIFFLPKYTIKQNH